MDKCLFFNILGNWLIENKNKKNKKTAGHMHNACTHTETHTACKGNNNMYDMVKLKGMLFALRFVLSKKGFG